MPSYIADIDEHFGLDKAGKRVTSLALKKGNQAHFYTTVLYRIDAVPEDVKQMLCDVYMQQFSGQRATPHDFFKRFEQPKNGRRYIDVIYDNVTERATGFTFQQVAEVDFKGKKTILCKHGVSASSENTRAITILNFRFSYAVALLYRKYPCYAYYASSSPISFSIVPDLLEGEHKNIEEPGSKNKKSNGIASYYPNIYWRASQVAKELVFCVLATFYPDAKLEIEQNPNLIDPVITVQRTLHTTNDERYRNTVNLVDRITALMFYYLQNPKYLQGFSIPVIFSLSAENFERFYSYYVKKRDINLLFEVGKLLQKKLTVPPDQLPVYRDHHELTINTRRIIKKTPHHWLFRPQLSLTNGLCDMTDPVTPQRHLLFSATRDRHAQMQQFGVNIKKRKYFDLVLEDKNQQRSLELKSFIIENGSKSALSTSSDLYYIRACHQLYEDVENGLSFEDFKAHFFVEKSPHARNFLEVIIDTNGAIVEKANAICGFIFYNVFEIRNNIIINVRLIYIKNTKTILNDLKVLALTTLSARFAYAIQCQNPNKGCYIHNQSIHSVGYLYVATMYPKYFPHPKYETPEDILDLHEAVVRSAYGDQAQFSSNGKDSVITKYTYKGMMLDSFQSSNEELFRICILGCHVYLSFFMNLYKNHKTQHGHGGYEHGSSFNHGDAVSLLIPMNAENFLAYRQALQEQANINIEDLMQEVSYLTMTKKDIIRALDESRREYVPRCDVALCKNMLQTSIVIFDWDGTLVDTSLTRLEATQAVFKRLKLEPVSDAHFAQLKGLSIEKAIQKLEVLRQEKLPRAEIKTAICDYQTTPKLFEYTRKCLVTLQQMNIKIAVVTNIAEEIFVREMKELQLDRFIDYHVCATENVCKPDPAMLHGVLNKFNLIAKQAVMVGDTIFDLQMAELCEQMFSICIRYRDEIVPDTTLYGASNLQEVLNFLIQKCNLRAINKQSQSPTLTSKL